MRGRKNCQPQFFYTIDVEARIRADHPLRRLNQRIDQILASLEELFAAAYSSTGRPSVPPERLLKALLLMALYSIRSERQLCERIDTDLLFRWFLDMSPEDPAFDARRSQNSNAIEAGARASEIDVGMNIAGSFQWVSCKTFPWEPGRLLDAGGFGITGQA